MNNKNTGFHSLLNLMTELEIAINTSNIDDITSSNLYNTLTRLSNSLVSQLDTTDNSNSKVKSTNLKTLNSENYSIV